MLWGFPTDSYIRMPDEPYTCSVYRTPSYRAMVFCRECREQVENCAHLLTSLGVVMVGFVLLSESERSEYEKRAAREGRKLSGLDTTSVKSSEKGNHMAMIDSKIVGLRDGRKVLIRCAQESEAPALLEAVRIVFLDGDGMITEADEFTKTEDDEKAWIKALNDDPKQLLLVADVDGLIVGNIDFHIKKARRVSHWGSFGMSVRPEWRSCGVGTALLDCLLVWARSVPEIEKVTLGVRADNHRAIALYNRHGFVQTGLEKNYLKMSDGSYVDHYTMETFVRS